MRLPRRSHRSSQDLLGAPRALLEPKSSRIESKSHQIESKSKPNPTKIKSKSKSKSQEILVKYKRNPQSNPNRNPSRNPRNPQKSLEIENQDFHSSQGASPLRAHQGERLECTALQPSARWDTALGAVHCGPRRLGNWGRIAGPPQRAERSGARPPQDSLRILSRIPRISRISLRISTRISLFYQDFPGFHQDFYQDLLGFDFDLKLIWIWIWIWLDFDSDLI